MQISRNEIDLLSQLLRSQGEHCKVLARLWETDPEEFGGDAESIALQRGRAEAFAEAAKLVDDLGSGDGK